MSQTHELKRARRKDRTGCPWCMIFYYHSHMFLTRITDDRRGCNYHRGSGWEGFDKGVHACDHRKTNQGMIVQCSALEYVDDYVSINTR